MLPEAVQSHVLSFWESNNGIVFSNVILFDGPITRARIYFTSSNALSDVV
jgi:hypothetical protein